MIGFDQGILSLFKNGFPDNYERIIENERTRIENVK